MGEPALKTSHQEPEVTAALEAAFKTYETFCKAMLDAYVVVDLQGRIIKCNQMFSQLIGKTVKQIQKQKTLGELLNFQLNGEILSAEEIIASPTFQRIDEVRGATVERTDLNLIIGSYPFKDANAQNIGAFILIRDVTAETNLQDKYKHTTIKSITDPLTGLFTRAYFEEYLHGYMANARQFADNSPQKVMSLIMLDIDFFKKVNDVHGHQAGDYVIQTVADLMKQIFRKTDIICRYGGEEFLTIMPGTELEGARIAAEKLRKAVEEKKLTYADKEIPITISSGAAQIIVGIESAEATIERADKALYNSKHSGRNRVSIHDGREILASAPLVIIPTQN